MLALMAASDAWTLRDLARTAVVDGPAAVSIVASDLDELGELLRAAAAGRTDPARGLYRAGSVTPTGKLAVLFPGQGSQRPGMLGELFVAFPELHQLARLGGPELAAMFAGAAFSADALREQEDRLRDTRAAQPALGIAGLAVHRLLDRLGVRADMYAGHSYGELVALAAAGAFDARTLVDVSRARARAILNAAGADPGGMLAVSAGRDEVEKALADAGLAGQVVIANHNAPNQVVVSGPTSLLERARAVLPGARSIPVACAFHSPVVRDAVDELAAVLAEVPVGVLDRPVWTNRGASRYPGGADEIRAEVAAQVGAPVRFVDQVEAMYAAGARIFLEAGPGQVLTGLVGRILGERPHTAVSLETSAAQGIHGLLHALAQLAVAGVPVQADYLFAGRDAREVSRLEAPATPGWTVDGHLVRTADGNPVPGGLTPAKRVGLVSGSSTRDTMVGEFLKASRELIAAQRDIMLGYLGSAPTAPPVSPEPERPVVREEEQPDLLSTVVRVIANRTGYPEDMIDPGLDLEADLSVDSIKRTEIAGELSTRLGLTGQVDRLVAARTAADLVAVLGGPAEPDLRLAGQAAQPVGATVAGWQRPAGGADSCPEPVVAGTRPGRFVLESVETFDGHIDPVSLLGATIVIAGGDPALAEELAGQLSARGAVPIVVAGRPAIDPRIDVHGLVSLHALETGGEPVLPGAFGMFKSVLGRQPRWCVAVAPADGMALGLRGFFRSLHRELPDTLVRLVEVEPGGTEEIAQVVATELQTRVGEPVITVSGERRSGFRMVPAELTPRATELPADSVVLLIGGARGITAGVAAALAERGCRIEVAGRTDHPGRAGYHRVDVRDAEAVRHLVKQVYAEHGRLDGVVYGAGIIEDALAVNKDPSSFDRVFETKVDGVEALFAGLDDLPERPGFVVLFGSIAAVLGNRGQADYAAANDALDALGAGWAARTGSRVLTVHWGPWAPVGEHPGMVDPALARAYTEQGIALIDPAAGVEALLAELAGGDPAVRSVIYTASGW
jgi:malonyl CoA-acyl carrier protein transacylase/NAD(P)-dependent dehydrogenase (short-subunit alcohol dehydrogenase family)